MCTIAMGANGILRHNMELTTGPGTERSEPRETSKEQPGMLSMAKQYIPPGNLT